MKGGTVAGNPYCNFNAFDLAPRAIDKIQARGLELQA